MKYILKNISAFFLIFLLFAFAGCGKSEMELQKEKLRKEAAELKAKIDSTQKSVDAAKKELDSSIEKGKKELGTIDSLKEVIESLKK